MALLSTSVFSSHTDITNLYFHWPLETLLLFLTRKTFKVNGYKLSAHGFLVGSSGWTRLGLGLITNRCSEYKPSLLP